MGAGLIEIALAARAGLVDGKQGGAGNVTSRGGSGVEMGRKSSTYVQVHGWNLATPGLLLLLVPLLMLVLGLCCVSGGGVFYD